MTAFRFIIVDILLSKICIVTFSNNNAPDDTRLDDRQLTDGAAVSR